MPLFIYNLQQLQISLLKPHFTDEQSEVLSQEGSNWHRHGLNPDLSSSKPMEAPTPWLTVGRTPSCSLETYFFREYPELTFPVWKGRFRTPGVMKLKRKARPSLLEMVKCCINVHSVVLSFYSFNVVFWERNCNVCRSLMLESERN